jgi:predicted nucleic acid-binding protein
MRYFIDTNVLIDIFVEDRPSHKDSTELFAKAFNHRAELIIASISILNTLYSLQKHRFDMEMAIGRLNLLLAQLELAPLTSVELVQGINSGWSDLEDAIQFYSAIAAGKIDAIVSNDKDFKHQKIIPVLTPAQALKRLRL